MKKTLPLFLLLSFSLFLHSQNKVQKIDKLLAAYNAQDALNGSVLVAESEKVIYKRGFGKANFEWDIPNKTDTKFEIASISKHITAIIILQMVEEGILNLEGKVSDYCKNYPKENGDKITLNQLLLHTSGLTDSRFIPDFETTEGMTSKSHWEHIKFFSETSLLFEPGTKWSYSNFGYNLLAYIAETVTGKPFHTLLQEKIFDRAGMKNSTSLEDPRVIKKLAGGYDTKFADIRKGLYHDGSFTFGNGSVVTTVEDYFLLWKALLNGKLLSPEYRDILFSPKTKSDNGEIFGYSVYFDKMEKTKAGSVTILRSAGNHYGIHTLVYNIKNDSNLVVIFLNAKNAMANIPSPIMFEIADNITKILYNVPYGEPKDSYARIFYNDVLKSGIAKAIKHYRELKRTKSCREHFAYLNRLGYYYLINGIGSTAIEVFKLNVENYPSNGDGFDSLGEAYMTTGNKALAIENYKKAIELDPSNGNAKSMLQKLMKDE